MTSQAGAASSSSEGPMRFFTGESEDTREYKRWKVWVQNKRLTLEKLPKRALGAYVYTLLLECVQHLEPAEYQKEDGIQVLWQLLDQRFRQKDKTDELGEYLRLVFGLKAQDGTARRSKAGWPEPQNCSSGWIAKLARASQRRPEAEYWSTEQAFPRNRWPWCWPESGRSQACSSECGPLFVLSRPCLEAKEDLQCSCCRGGDTT